MLFWPVQAVQASIATYNNTNTQKADIVPTINWPTYGQSAIGTLDGNIISTAGDQTPVPIASITKVITALTVLKHKPLTVGQPGPTITFSAEDAERYNYYYLRGGTIAKSDAGLQITQYQMLQGILISSANNYADTLALWAFGSMDAYLNAAQKYLADHNLSSTTVADASGFSPDSKSTASDLVTLGKLALSHPVVAEIVSQKTATIPGVGTLHNTNLLVGTEGIIGIKTGTTDEAGSCLLFAARYTIGNTPVTLIGATLGGPNHSTLARDVLNILESTKNGFQEIKLASIGQRFATYNTPWEKEAHAIASKNIKVVMWPGAEVKQKVTVSPLKPGKNPKYIGSVTFTVNGQTLSTDLMLDRPLEKPELLWRLAHPAQIIAR